jgi:hypothetical protein
LRGRIDWGWVSAYVPFSLIFSRWGRRHLLDSGLNCFIFLVNSLLDCYFGGLFNFSNSGGFIDF